MVKEVKARDREGGKGGYREHEEVHDVRRGGLRVTFFLFYIYSFLSGARCWSKHDMLRLSTPLMFDVVLFTEGLCAEKWIAQGGRELQRR